MNCSIVQTTLSVLFVLASTLVAGCQIEKDVSSSTHQGKAIGWTLVVDSFNLSHDRFWQPANYPSTVSLVSTTLVDRKGVGQIKGSGEIIGEIESLKNGDVFEMREGGHHFRFVVIAVIDSGFEGVEPGKELILLDIYEASQ